MVHRSRSGIPFALVFLPVFGACGSGGDGGGSGAGLDTTPPAAGVVMDGLGGDVDTQTSTTTLSANWAGFTDDSGTIEAYRWAIGTTPGGTEIQDWASVGTATEATTTSVALSPGTTCYVAVRAYDPAGNVSPAAVSDGVTIETPPGGGGGGGATGTYAESVTQWGITWRFQE
ncbi:MAG: hypothetical protein FJ265_14195, partial [Planctomycetes bacterium]|nr:hypothetical protein [Planctomycetota bacterium]